MTCPSPPGDLFPRVLDFSYCESLHWILHSVQIFMLGFGICLGMAADWYEHTCASKPPSASRRATDLLARRLWLAECVLP